MKQVQYQEISSFLESNKIQFSLLGVAHKLYTIASLFAPIPEGFYFFTGTHLPSHISDSLFLVGSEFIGEVANGNAVLKINSDPQLVYYTFLSQAFGVRSTGKISESAQIHPEAKIGANVEIGHFTVVGKAVIGDNSIIRNHCVVNDYSEIASNVIIEDHSIIGAQGVAWIWNKEQTEKVIQPQLGGVRIGKNVFLGANTIIVRGSINEYTSIEADSLLAPGCRIGHGTQIGSFVHFANNVITGGNTQIGDNCFIGSGAIFRPKVRLHANTVVGAGAVVVKNTTDKNKLLTGVPATEQNVKPVMSGMPKPKL